MATTIVLTPYMQANGIQTIFNGAELKIIGSFSSFGNPDG